MFERENVYFPDSTGISRTNLLKSLLHVIETSCMVNCAGTFRSKNPGLIRKQCKAGPFEIRNKDLVWHICPSKKYHICMSSGHI